MSIKSEGRRLGRMIRRITGLPLPVAMRIGRLVAQGTSASQLVSKIPEMKTGEAGVAGCTCCKGTSYILTGPKGSIEGNYGFDERAITKEYSMMQQS